MYVGVCVVQAKGAGRETERERERETVRETVCLLSGQAGEPDVSLALNYECNSECSV